MGGSMHTYICTYKHIWPADPSTYMFMQLSIKAGWQPTYCPCLGVCIAGEGSVLGQYHPLVVKAI